MLVFVEEWIMRALQVRHYIERAGDFLEGMKSLQALDECPNASALLAIHSAVSYSDALREGLGDETLSSDDHRNAASSLETLLSARRMLDVKGIAHFRYLLSKKGLVAYGGQKISNTEYQTLVIKAERFAVWANRVGSHLKIEGWAHDN